jgi:hypothetical protein
MSPLIQNPGHFTKDGVWLLQMLNHPAAEDDIEEASWKGHGSQAPYYQLFEAAMLSKRGQVGVQSHCLSCFLSVEFDHPSSTTAGIEHPGFRGEMPFHQTLINRAAMLVSRVHILVDGPVSILLL